MSDFEMSSDLDFKQLSMGQKKKVYMSFALATGCRIILMDEPTNGLDIPSKALFRQVVAGNMTEGSSLVISTHQVHDEVRAGVHADERDVERAAGPYPHP